MDTPVYTRKDMEKLCTMSEENTLPRVYLPELGYDPKALRKLLESYGLKKDIHYLFLVPTEDVPLLVGRGEVSGYLRFRLQVGK